MVEEIALETMARRLTENAGLNASDRDAVLGLLGRAETYAVGDLIVQQGVQCRQAAIILDGFAYGEVSWRNDLRQIVAFHLIGDLLDLHGALTGISGETVIAATDCKIAAISAEALANLIESRPQIGRALWIETLAEAAIAREWIMNVGQRSARQRLAHLCCELAWRAREAGLGDGQSFPLPITLQQLADATGLTRLHVNHTLQKLEADGLVVRVGPDVHVLDAAQLRQEADFHEQYLCGKRKSQ